MLPYWLLFGGFSAGTFVNGDNMHRPRPGALLSIAALLTVLMIGFRYRVGGDWGQYARMYRHISTLDLGTALTLNNSDPAYSLINWGANLVGGDIWLVNLLCGAALVLGLLSLANRQPNPWLLFVVAVPYLIIVVGMGYTRQAAAIGLTMIAVTRLLDGHLLKFFGLMVLAAMFHQSAVILLPIVGLALSHNRLLTVAMTALLAVFLYYFLVAARLDLLAQNYLGEQIDSQGAAIRLMINVVPAALFLLTQRSFGFADHERQIWRMMSIAALAAATAFLFVPSSTVVDRLALYLIPVQLVVLARLPWAFGGTGEGRLLLITLVIVYSAVIQFVWLNYALHAYAWVPYRLYPFFS